MNVIQTEIEQLRKEVPSVNKYKDEYLFSFVCYKYFYNNGIFENSTLKDCFVDGKNDGGIDLVTINDVSDIDNSLVLMQSKSQTELKNKQEIIDIFTKMSQTYENFKKNITSKYNDRLRRILREKIEEIDDRSYSVELQLFINVSISESKLKELEEAILKVDSLSLYKTAIFDKNRIESQIEIIKEPKYYANQGKLKFLKSNGILKYKENGIMLNVYASSLKSIYELYKDAGLFEQNFRYFIRQKKIDANINNSIAKKKEDFWFLNNGIIIGCSSFTPDGSYINLSEFSIINGCQTTTLIGEHDGINEKNDFLIHCKIIASNPISEQDFITSHLKIVLGV